MDRVSNPSIGKLITAHTPTKLSWNRIDSGMTTHVRRRLGGREMFCNLNYRQVEGALEGLDKDRETTFQRIRQRQGCEEK